METAKETEFGTKVA